MRRRRFLALTTGMAGSIAWTATGCGDSGTARSDGHTLTMIATDYGGTERGTSTQAYWDEVVASFRKKRPDVEVKVITHSARVAERKVAELVDKGEPPDIAQITSFAGHAAAGRLHVTNEVLSIPVQADFVPALASAGELRRVQYALPFVANLQLLFYNRDLFATAGLDPERPPRTWEELKDCALALRAVGVDVPYGLAMGPEDAHVEAMTWMLGNGGGFTGENGMYAIDAPENVQTMSWLRKELVGRGLTTTSPALTSRRALSDLFAKGKVGMLNGNLSLMLQADAAGLAYGTAPVPGRTDLSRTTMGSAHWMLAFRKEGNGDVVGAFLDHVYAEENHHRFAVRHNTLPVTVSATERMARDEGNARMRPFLDRLGAAEFHPSHKVSWNAVGERIKERIGQAVLTDGDPKSVLGALQDTAEKEDAAAR
ncbi:extracellular solute-binding protein [Streptomyces sp. TRM43335]|uniref:Extracellular solute-binding protein n=1 Tax=Streptomyces taklimakanensis TaxID=2569853 RepID=A0A6G2BCQ3_9ACTN|nr:extracellular solute-binding protein [Streptomyces taklimakanensis]MTE19682.1 extracellular solute-binding protein [Streptomyces taklimakanensis]